MLFSRLDQTYYENQKQVSRYVFFMKKVTYVVRYRKIDYDQKRPNFLGFYSPAYVRPAVTGNVYQGQILFYDYKEQCFFDTWRHQVERVDDARIVINSDDSDSGDVDKDGPYWSGYSSYMYERVYAEKLLAVITPIDRIRLNEYERDLYRSLPRFRFSEEYLYDSLITKGIIRVKEMDKELAEFIRMFG